MRSYLVALDSSPRAPQVLAAAIALAKTTSAKLVLFRAVGVLVDLPIEAYAMPPDDVVDLLQQRAKTELNDVSKVIPGGVPFETRVDVGIAWQAICDAAKDTNAAMIVIGSHGYSALDRLLGTTAARVVNHADRSVMVVRQHELVG